MLLCHLVFKIGSPRVLHSVWATALSPASWNWPFKSFVPCHLAFKMGPLKSAVLYLHRPEALLYHLASWNCPSKGLMLCFSGPEVLTYAWLPQHRPSKRTPLCLCRPWGAAVITPDPRRQPFIPVQMGTCLQSSCWHSGGGSWPRFSDESVVLCQEAAEETGVDAIHTTSRIPAFIQAKDAV